MYRNAKSETWPFMKFFSFLKVCGNRFAKKRVEAQVCWFLYSRLDFSREPSGQLLSCTGCLAFHSAESETLPLWCLVSSTNRKGKLRQNCLTTHRVNITWQFTCLIKQAMKQGTTQVVKMWQEFKILIMASVGLKRGKKCVQDQDKSK